MILPPNDARDFFRLIQQLDVYFFTRLRMLQDTSLEQIKAQRDAGFADPAHIQSYIKKNPDKLPAADLATIHSWQEHTITGRFLIHQERKDGCLFSHSDQTDAPQTAFLVKGLTQPISELVPCLPCFAEARLLPFRGHIVTDGIIAPLMVGIGRSMRTSFAAELKETIATRGIVTTLPPDTAAPDPAAQLTAYLATVASRRDYAPQIASLRRQSPALNLLYLQHTGRLNSKKLKATLKSHGLTTGHFAILEDTIITGAPDKTEATRLAAGLLPPDQLDALVWIKL